MGTDVLTLFKCICSSLGDDYTDKKIISDELTESKLVLDIGLAKKIYNKFKTKVLIPRPRTRTNVVSDPQ